MNAPIADTSSFTEVNEPRRMAWRVITEKKHSARLSHEQLVGVKTFRIDDVAPSSRHDERVYQARSR